MTNMQAIEQLKYMYKNCMNERCKHKGQCDLCCDARDMAIEALRTVEKLKENEDDGK